MGRYRMEAGWRTRGSCAHSVRCSPSGILAAHCLRQVLARCPTGSLNLHCRLLSSRHVASRCHSSASASVCPSSSLPPALRVACVRRARMRRPRACVPQRPVLRRIHSREGVRDTPTCRGTPLLYLAPRRMPLLPALRALFCPALSLLTFSFTSALAHPRSLCCALPGVGGSQMSHRLPQPTLPSSLLASCCLTPPFFCFCERLPFPFPPPFAPAVAAALLMPALSLASPLVDIHLSCVFA